MLAIDPSALAYIAVGLLWGGCDQIVAASASAHHARASPSQISASQSNYAAILNPALRLPQAPPTP